MQRVYITDQPCAWALFLYDIYFPAAVSGQKLKNFIVEKKEIITAEV